MSNIIKGEASFDSVHSEQLALFDSGVWANASHDMAWAKLDFDKPYAIEKITVDMVGLLQKILKY